MKTIITFFCMFSLTLGLKSQTAMDFNMSDCSGNMHHLYTDYLDNEEVVIIEFFMTCSSCIETGQRLTPMYNQLAIDYPGQVNFFAFNFLDDLDCSVATNFATTFGINAIPFDSGEAQLNYYYDGVFGMPNVVIVAGSEHRILYQSRDGIDANDTIAMDSTIRNFFTTLSTNSEEDQFHYQIYPNPASNDFSLQIDIPSQAECKIQILDIFGKLIRDLVVQAESGANNFKVETSDLSDGLYLVNIDVNKKVNQYKLNIKH